jgi:integrase
MRRRRGLTTTRPGSPHRYANFTVGGRRFRHSLGTDDEAEAEIIVAKLRSDALLGKLTDKKPQLSLTHALGRYLEEHAQHLASVDDIMRMGRVLCDSLGRQTLLTEITAGTLATYAARRRAHLSNRSVNIELEHLRAVIRRAGTLWGAAVPDIPWKRVLLEEAGEHEHILSASEEERLFDALRSDFHAMVRFALLSGARLGNVIGLTWSQVDFDAETIAWQTKSKRPGGRRQVLPLTPALAAVVSGERGRHPVYVFTYAAARNRHDRHRGTVQAKGDRYPFTITGWRREWARALAAAGIADFRFHDLRHTAATRKLRASGNLPAVQHMLGHTSIDTTLRYARTAIADVRAMMEVEEMTQSRHNAVSAKRKA